MADELAPVPPDEQVLIYQDGTLKLHVRLDGQTVWLTQRLIAELFDVSVKTANEHLVNIYDEGELAAVATIRKNAKAARQVLLLPSTRRNQPDGPPKQSSHRFASYR